MKISAYSRAIGAPAVAATAVMLIAAAAQAEVNGFVNNAEGNSVDWTNYVLNNNGSIFAGMTFDGHPTGPLQGDFYESLYGVTMTQSGFGNVETGLGALAGSLDEPLTIGEGQMGSATYLRDDYGPGAWELTLTFEEAVFAIGFMTADYFNPFNDNPMTLEIFDGPDGTGNLIGSVDALDLNFQLNYLYFLGITDSTSSIRSARLSGAGNYSDTVFLDSISFARIPGPGTLVCLALGLAGSRRRRS